MAIACRNCSSRSANINTLGVAFIVDGAGADYSFYGFRVTSTTNSIFESLNNASIELGLIILSSAPYSQLNAHYIGSIYINDACVIEDRADCHIRISNYGLIEESRTTIIIVNNPNFKTAFIIAEKKTV